MYKKIIILIFMIALEGCAETGPLEVARGLLGYIPPPEETTIAEELKLEFDRCKKLNVEENCAQAAYDTVRIVKGLEPRKVPEGIVIILEGDGGYGDSESSDDDKNQDRSHQNND